MNSPCRQHTPTILCYTLTCRCLQDTPCMLLSPSRLVQSPHHKEYSLPRRPAMHSHQNIRHCMSTLNSQVQKWKSYRHTSYRPKNPEQTCKSPQGRQRPHYHLALCNLRSRYTMSFSGFPAWSLCWQGTLCMSGTGNRSCLFCYCMCPLGRRYN